MKNPFYYFLFIFFIGSMTSGHSQSLNPTIKLNLDARVFKDIDKFRSGDSFAEIESGEMVEVLDVQSPYLLIKYDSIIGLIGYGRVDPSSYDPHLKPFKVEYPMEITLDKEFIMVDSPSKIGDRIQVLKSGSKIILLSKDKDFYKIKYNTIEGFVHESVYTRDVKNPIAIIYDENTPKKNYLISSFQSGNYRTETYEVNGKYYTITYKNGKVIDRSTYSTFFK